MKPTYNYELIEDYLEGLLDQDTSRRVNELLLSDDIARNIAKGIVTLKHNLNENEIDQYLDNIYRRHLETINQYSKPKKRFVYWKIAAALLLAAVSSFLVFTAEQTTIEEIIAAETASPYPVTQSLRNESSQVVNMALIAYSNGEYEQVILSLDRTTAQNTFTLGLSNFYLANYTQASREFASSLLQDSRYEEQARWFLALSCAKNDEHAKAQAIISEMLAIEGHYKKEEASKLLLLLSN